MSDLMYMFPVSLQCRLPTMMLEIRKTTVSYQTTSKQWYTAGGWYMKMMSSHGSIHYVYSS